MLYLFDITKFPSNWMHLDMGLTAVSVQTLKEHIESKYKISADDQVLLISGGVCLDSAKIVCHYSAGTDSNPIYFFNKRVDKAGPFPECPDVSTTTDDLNTLYKKYAKVTPSFQAVIDRASLAEKFAKCAASLLEHCEEIIRDHHIANQGWLAAIANYDDVVSNCHNHFEESQKNFEKYLGERDYFLNFLEKFKDKLPIFKKIPILQKLLRPNDGDSRLMIESHTAEGASSDKETEDPCTTFFDWVGKDEHGNSIDTIYKNCEEEVEFYKEEYFQSSFSSVPHTLAAADSSNKEINVGFWLSHLDQLMIKARKIVEEQSKISSSIQLNVARMKDCKDLSILPHLCETHEQELQVMNENHGILKNIENTCIKAKYEFTLNVQSRISWIVHIENELQHIGVQLDIFNETIERLRYQIAILEKIYMAPTAYFACIGETVRRRSFSQAFLMWASEMACRLHTMHNDEVARRKEFLSKYEDTFIQMLFPGLEDLPPSYGTKAPSYFDTSLPKLTIEDIDFLKKMLPDLPKELTECLSLEDSSNLSHYLSTKLLLNTQTDNSETETQPEHSNEKVENVSANMDQSNMKEGVGESSLTAIHGLSHLKDLDRGCESETDTEEFEKVGQSPMELHVSTQKRSTQDVSTSTEVGERKQIPPKKPPRTFQKLLTNQTNPLDGTYPRTQSISSSQSNTESFINIKNPSLESIDESLSSLKNLSYNSESCFYSHYQQMQPPDQSGQVKLTSPDNLELCKSEHNKLRSIVNEACTLASHSLIRMKSDFDELKNDYSLSKSELLELLKTLMSKYEKLCDEQKNHEHSIITRLTTDHKNEISDFRRLAQVKNDEIKNLRTNLTFLENKMKKISEDIATEKRNSDDYKQKYEELRHQVSALESDKERSIREVTERLNREHLDKMKTLQSRFRLMTMERTPSDSSLEKALDFSTSINHESIYIQMKDNFEFEKEKFMRETLLQETERWKRTVEELEEKFENEKKVLQESLKKEMDERSCEETKKFEEKEKQFREEIQQYNDTIKELSIVRDFSQKIIQQYEESIMQATEKWKTTVEDLNEKLASNKNVSEGSSKEDSRCEELETFGEKEKQFKKEIEQYTKTIKELSYINDFYCKLCEKYDEMMREQGNQTESPEREQTSEEQSQTVPTEELIPKGKVNSATSPIKRKSISKTVNVLGKSSKPMLESITPGDNLVVVWDEDYENFRIVQKGPIIYFLHLDCLPSLGLEILEGSPKRPNKLYCMAEYVEKEYCYARKSENRFNVPQGTRFFRVTVKPLQQEKPILPTPETPPLECLTSSQQSSSISIAEMDQTPLADKSRRVRQNTREHIRQFRLDRLRVRKLSDNKPQGSNDSLPFQTANFDNDLKQEPVDSGESSSESLR